mmetsp:Transcript_42522/g.112325  ORF Transcript_42522/g.112325 Transcript_42522/m.112325 type:complete len:111 (-) Transcript_42522:10-342(-)
MTVLAFLSKSYFQSKACQRELRAAMEARKPLLLVAETDPTKGFVPLERHRGECLDDLRDYVFSEEDGGARAVIRFSRQPNFKLLTMKLIIGQMLLHSPAHKARDCPLIAP